MLSHVDHFTQELWGHDLIREKMKFVHAHMILPEVNSEFKQYDI